MKSAKKKWEPIPISRFMDLPFVKYTFPALAMFLSLFISEKEQRSMLMMAHDKHLWLRKNVGTVQQNTRLPWSQQTISNINRRFSALEHAMWCKRKDFLLVVGFNVSLLFFDKAQGFGCSAKWLPISFKVTGDWHLTPGAPKPSSPNFE